MKIKLRILAIVMLCFGVSNHNVFSQTGLSYGAKVGAVVSEFSNSQPHTYQKLGFTVAAVVEYGFNDKLSAQVEPAYLQQGGTYVRFSDDTRFGTNVGILSDVYTTNNRITLHSFDLPVLAKYRPFTFGDMHTNIVLGPSFSYVINAVNAFERTYHYNQTFTTVNGTTTVNSEYRNMHYAVTAGMGIELPVGEKIFMVDLRSKIGFTPVKESYSYIELNDVQGDLRNNSYYFTIGLKF